MRTKLFLFLQLTGILCASVIPPTPSPCTAATLDVYTALGATGCTIDDFIYKNFAFQTLSATGGAIPISAEAINVQPSSGGGNMNVFFTSSGFSISGTQFVQYRIDYTVDPLPPVIIRFEDDMIAESPVAPGTADITTDLCVNSLFGDVTPCAAGGTFLSLNVFHHGTPTDKKLFDQVMFPGTNLVDVRNTITLAANGATSQIDGFGNVTGLPEPGAYVLAGSGLLALLLRRVRSKAL
jgi:hypothetical protein